MESFNYTIKDKLGIHARPAGNLAKTAKGFESSIAILKGDKQCDAKKLMQLMGMGIKCGDEITVRVEGTDETAAAAALREFLRGNL